MDTVPLAPGAQHSGGAPALQHPGVALRGQVGQGWGFDSEVLE